ncbi:thioesterase II family protein [Streptomyces xanthii]|uniref:thioesterase II family protein n=1 Tax=Streptomyces xanthii TaxID=2768069 RepID=UPI001CB79C60|nr:alpha/beta fold hydrolase [Streptomyces xanthii]
MSVTWTAAGTEDARTASDGGGLRLFCFAHAGGGSSFFHPWREALGPGVDVRPVVLPGRERRSRQASHTRMGPLVEELTAELAGQLDRPYVLFGHSLGSIVAYETARALLERGSRPPSALLVSGRRGPFVPDTRPPVHNLPEDAFLTEVSRLGGTPPELLRQRELVRHFLPPLRADHEINETYRPTRLPGPALTCPVFAFTGAADPLADPHAVARWREVTSGDFRLRVFPGDHFYLKGAPEDLMTALRTALSGVDPLSSVLRRPFHKVAM